MEQFPVLDPDFPSGKGLALRIEVQYPFLFGIGEYLVYRVQKIVVFDLCHII